MSKKTILAGTMILAVAAGGSYIGYTVYQNRNQTVTVYPVSKLSNSWWGNSTTLSGTVVSGADVEYHAAQEKTIGEVYVEEGQPVRTGDPLFSYDQTMEELNLELEEINAISLEMRLKKAEKQLSQLKQVTPVEKTETAVVPDNTVTSPGTTAPGTVLQEASDPVYVISGNSGTTADPYTGNMQTSGAVGPFGENTVINNPGIVTMTPQAAADTSVSTAAPMAFQKKTNALDVDGGVLTLDLFEAQNSLQNMAISRMDLPSAFDSGMFLTPVDFTENANAENEAAVIDETDSVEPVEPVEPIEPVDPVDPDPFIPETDPLPPPETESPFIPVPETEDPQREQLNSLGALIGGLPDPYSGSVTLSVLNTNKNQISSAMDVYNTLQNPALLGCGSIERLFGLRGMITGAAQASQGGAAGDPVAFNSVSTLDGLQAAIDAMPDPANISYTSITAYQQMIENAFSYYGSLSEDQRLSLGASRIAKLCRLYGSVLGVRLVGTNGYNSNNYNYSYPNYSYNTTPTTDMTNPDGTLPGEEDGTGLTLAGDLVNPDGSVYTDDGSISGAPGEEYGMEMTYTAKELAEAISYAENQIVSLKLDIRESELRLRQLTREKEEGVVTATTDGTVSYVGDPEKGETDGMAFVRISSDKGVYITGTVDELTRDTLEIGDIVTGTTFQSGESFTAELEEISEYPTDDYIAYNTDYNSSYYYFRAYVEDPGNLTARESVEIVIGAPESAGVSVYLDKAYVRSENGKSYVYKAGPDSTLKKQYVSTGAQIYSTIVEVTDGLTITDYIAFPYGKEVREGARTADENGNPVHLQEVAAEEGSHA